MRIGIFSIMCHLSLGLQKKSLLNSYNFTILRSVFYSSNVCVSNRNIYISYTSFAVYVAFSSCLRRERQFVVVVVVVFPTRSTKTCLCHGK